MKLAEAAASTNKSNAAILAEKFLRNRRKDEVFTPRELAAAIHCSPHHTAKFLVYDPLVARFTRNVRNRRWFGRPEALDALERML